MSNMVNEAAFAQKDSVPVRKSMLSVEELNRRPSRAPDYKAESQALVALANAMAVSPDVILHKLAETALELCGAHSAGMSLLEAADRKSRFHWRVIVGAWKHNLNGGRRVISDPAGPCSTIMHR